MYFNVDLDVFFKLINVLLLVSELYIMHLIVLTFGFWVKLCFYTHNFGYDLPKM